MEEEHDVAGSNSLDFVSTFVGVGYRLYWAGTTPWVKEAFRSKFGVD